MPERTFLVVVASVVCSASHAFQLGTAPLALRGTWRERPLRDRVSVAGAAQVGHLIRNANLGILSFRANLENNTGRVRTRSPETRKRISEALKKKWAEDPYHRQRVATTSVSAETRKKIAASLRERWRDPTVRGEMSEKRRQKISDAIKLKWLDPVYRESATSGIRQASRSPHTPQSKQRQSEAAKERWGNRPVVRADRMPKPTAPRAVKREAKPASASRDKTAASKPLVAAKASSALPPRALSSEGIREPKLTPSMYKVQNAPASREPLVAAKVAKSANVLSSAATGEAIKPSTSGHNNVLRAQAAADAAAAATLSKKDAETARIARLKVDHFDLWSALYAEDEEIYQRPILSKAKPVAISVGRR